MNPVRTAQILRSIAVQLEDAEKPSISLVEKQLNMVVSSLDGMPTMDSKTKRDIEKQSEDTVKKTTDEFSKKMKDLTKKGLSGDDIAEAIGDVSKHLEDAAKR